jgi:hypothetical protein
VISQELETDRFVSSATDLALNKGSRGGNV